MHTDEITESAIEHWEFDQDAYSAPACFARMTRGAQTGRELLWNACWFERRWADKRPLLHPLAQYQRQQETPFRDEPWIQSQDVVLLAAIARADNYLNTIRAAYELRAGAANAPAGGTLAADPPGTGVAAASSPAATLRQELLQRAAGDLDALANHLEPFVPESTIASLDADAAALLAWARELEVGNV